MAEEREKELRRMNRTELIEIIYALKKEEEKATAKCEELERKLKERTIQIEQAGSIAEAAMKLNRVFTCAQAAADDYLNAIHASNAEAEEYAEQIRKNAEEEVQKLKCQTENAVRAEVENMRLKCQSMYAEAEQKQLETDKRCREMLQEAEEERKKKWDDFEEKCGAYMKQHQELTTLLQSLETYTGGEK